MHISEFRDFFTKAKVKYDEYPFSDIAVEAAFVYPANTDLIITVLTNNYLFSEHGNFIGVMCGESGVLQLVGE